MRKPWERPVLIGQISLALNLRISEVERTMEDLVAEGLVRTATPAELRQFDIRQGFILV